MRESNEGCGVAMTLVVVLVLGCVGLMIVAGGGVFLMWQRQAVSEQQMVLERERAQVEAAEAFAMANDLVKQAADGPTVGAEVSETTRSSGGLSAPEQQAVKLELEQAMAAWVQAWNLDELQPLRRLLLDAPSTTFVLGDRRASKPNGILDLLKKRYPDGRGFLELDQIKTPSLRSDVATIHSGWLRKDKSTGELLDQGYLTATVEKRDGRWLVAHLHMALVSL